MQEPRVKIIDEDTYLSLTKREASIKLVRDEVDFNHVPVSVKIHTNLSDSELEVVQAMKSSGNNLYKFDEHLVGGIWLSVSNLIFTDMKPVEARLYIIENAFHPKVIPDHIKEYAGVSNEMMLKGNELFYSKGLRGVSFLKNFHLAYLVQGMEKHEVMRFLIRNEYKSEDIPTMIRRRMSIDMSKLSLGVSLTKNENSLEKVYEVLEI